MIKIGFTPEFFRRLKKLPSELQEDAFEKIELFRNRKNHQRLRIHKLKGIFTGFYSFSVNYGIRIMFEWRSKNEALLHAIGDHSIYD